MSIEQYPNGNNKKCKEYQKISFEVHIPLKQARKQLIKLVESERFSVKKAAQKVNVNYSTAKLIINKFKTEGKITIFSYEKNLPPTLIDSKQEQSLKKSDQKDFQFSDQKEAQNIQNSYQNLPIWYWVPSYNWNSSQGNFLELLNQPIHTSYNLSNAEYYCCNFW